MSEEIVTYNEGNVITHGDDIVAIAAQAEARISAVIKIKQTALMVTNGGDWVDQDGKPYLMASGAEKIANLFNVSWRFLTSEPIKMVDPDGHYTYTYAAEFRMGSRTIEVEGSRSSKDGFFRQYSYPEGGGKKTEKAIHERNNERDVKMAALTNLLGNGITRLLGIRNLSYADLEQFAGITQSMMGKVAYKKKEEKPPVSTPKSTTQTPPVVNGNTVTGIVETVSVKTGIGKKGPWSKYGIKIGEEWYGTFDSKIGINAEAFQGSMVSLTWGPDGKYKACQSITPITGEAPASSDPAGCTKIPVDCPNSYTTDTAGEYICTENGPACKYAEGPGPEL